MAEQKSLPVVIVLLLVGATVILPLTVLGEGCDDNVDTDEDGFSDCVEVEYTFTNPALEDTDGDGIKDGLDVMPRGTEAGSYLRQSESTAAVSLEIVELWRLTACEPYWGNKWDPYISTAYVSVPSVASASFSTVGLSRTLHQDERPSGPLDIPPAVSITLPNDVGSFNLEPTRYPALEITIAMKEHDTPGDDTIELGDGSDTLEVSIPIWTPTVGAVLGNRYTGMQGSCRGEIALQWQSDLLRTEVIAAVMAEAAIAANSFLRASDLRKELVKDDCNLLAPLGDPRGDRSGPVGAVCSAALSFDLAPEPQGVWYLDLAALDAPNAALDTADPEHPVNHAIGPYG